MRGEGGIEGEGGGRDGDDRGGGVRGMIEGEGVMGRGSDGE